MNSNRNNINAKKKNDADKLLESVRAKARNPREIQLKGFHLASLYFQAKEYDTALHHALDYINVKPNDVRAHRLIGEIYESLQDIQKAVDSYRRALELDDKQKDIVLKVAELYCHVQCDAERHRFWAERAEKYFPGNQKIYIIMEHIYRKSGKLNDYRNYLNLKLKSCPQDLTLNLKMLEVLIEQKQMKEARQLCIQTQGTRHFDLEPLWWKKSYQLYQMLLTGVDNGDHSADHIIVFCHMLVSINKLVDITLSIPNTAVSQASKLLKVMNKELLRASDYINACQKGPDYFTAQCMLTEMKAQLYTHLATLLIKMAAMVSLRWADVMGIVTACYLVSAQVPSSGESSEIQKDKSLTQGLSQRLYSLSQCRLSEVCHMLTSIAKQQKNNEWLKICHGKWCSEEGRQALLSQAFGEGGIDPASSFLTMDDSLVKAIFAELPSLNQVFTHDQESIKCDPASLQRLVWLGLQWDMRQDGILPDLGQFLQPIFSRLLFSTQHLENTAVDNIRLLDLEAFLYCCVHLAKLQQEHVQARSQTFPTALPLGLWRGICSQQQVEWYTALYSLYTAKPSDRVKFRLTVQKGLEVLRCRMNHGLETSLLIRLGRTFRERMQEVQKASEGEEMSEHGIAFQKMSIMYWTAALDHLKLMNRNQAVPIQQKPFFPCAPRPMQTEEIQKRLDEGTVALAECKFQQGHFQQAVSMLDKTKSSTGSYLKAQMYMAKAHTEAKGLEVNSSPLSRQGDLLDKAKFALFQTMDAIQNQPDNPLHEQVQTSLLEIDSQLAKLSHQVAEVEQEEMALDSSRSLNDSKNLSTNSDAIPLEPSNDPSPRRLASELRSLNISHGRVLEENSHLRSLAATHSRILEQNQMLIEKQSTLMESNNALMKQVLELNMKFQELSTAQANRASASPMASQQQGIPDNINSNRPIIITAQECKIDNPNMSTSQLGAVHPMMAHTGIASPMHGIASPMQGLPAAQLSALYHPAYGYYTAPQGYGLAAYDGSGLHPSLITSTPTMQASRVPGGSQYMMYDDITSPTEVEAASTMASDTGRMARNDAQPSTSSKANAQLQAAVPECGISSDKQQCQVGEPAGQGMSTPTGVSAKVGSPFHTGVIPVQATDSSGQDVAGSSPLLMSMLMTKDNDVAPTISTKNGSITTGTPPKSLFSKSSAASTAPATMQPSGKDKSGQPIFASQAGSIFGSTGKQPSAVAEKSTFAPSTASSSSSALTSFSFKQGQPLPSTFGQFQPPLATSTAATSSASPFAGFSFGQSKPLTASSLTFGGFNPNQDVGFQPPKPSENQQKQVEEDEDDVVIVSMTMPSAEQIARAEALMLPPTFFMYEDEPPCPGCIGCEPEDLAARANVLQAVSKSTVPTEIDVSRSVEAKSVSAPLEDKSKIGGKQDSEPQLVFGSGKESGVSFAALSSDKQGTFASAVSMKGFTFCQAGAQVFGSAGNEECAEENEEHDPHFEPITSLPEVDTKTGEEDEEIMYKQRARLYRFVKDLAVWKERGIGVVKILKHNDTGALRLIMRREQVLKLCANHRITADMKLDTLMSSDRSWVWHAMDYSEEEPCHQQFALKFKTPEQAQEFKDRFEELQALRIEEEKEIKKVEEPKEDERKTEEKNTDEGSGQESDKPDQVSSSDDLFAKFRPKPGDWKCDGCWLNNKSDNLTCVACQTPKPGQTIPAEAATAVASTPAQVTSTNASSDTAGLEFNLSSGGGFSFGGGKSSDISSKASGIQFGGAPSFKSAGQSSAPLLSDGPIIFGTPQSDTTTPQTQPNTGQFTFGSGFQKFDFGGAGDKVSPVGAMTAPSTGFTFGTSKAAATDSNIVESSDASSKTEQATPATGYVFGASNQVSTQSQEEKSKDFSFSDMAKSKGSLFSFRLDVSNTPIVASEKSNSKPKSPSLVKSPGLNKSGGSDYYKDDDGDDIHFEPVVELPECVEVRTGEEDEVAKFSQRAKLFRFDKESSQWKERGIGDIKLLYNPMNKKYRIVMRREQVLKVCANHYVTPELQLQANAGSAKSWVWMAMDASEDEVQVEQLAVRFKQEEVAQEFKVAIDAAQEDMKKALTEGNDKEGSDAGESHAKEQEESQDDVHETSTEGEEEDDNDAGYDENKDDIEGDENDDDDDYEDVEEEEDGQDEDEQAPTTEGDAEEPVVRACDASISLAFSELLRSANASHKQKQEDIPATDAASKDEEGAASKDNSISEERDDIHFEPIAHLPEKVETITGEEDESQLFCSRAKLYRYDKATSQWKDRGIGDIKILLNSKTNKYRIIMRREHVLRVCANHYITKEMSLHPNAGSENSLVWQAMDASDGEPQPEELAVRFKLAGTTQRFKTIFEECQEKLGKASDQGESTGNECQDSSSPSQQPSSTDDNKQT